MGFTLPSFWRASTPPTTAQLNEQRALDATATLELEGAQDPQSKTIASGSISPTSAYVIVDTEGSAEADDLSVISPVRSASENLHTGMTVNLKAADSGRVVTVKNSSSANGINTYDGNDYVLSTAHWLKLQLRTDGKWYEINGRAMEVAESAATAAASASTPATTTARGIGRVATAADAAPGSTITSSPAFLDAATWKISATPAAGIIPLADGGGKLDAWVSPQTQFATCATAAATAAKDATLTGFSLVKGARVFVTFSNTNTVAGALTLNVNSTGAKAIYNELGAVSATNPATFTAGVPIEFVYDGTNWTYRKYQDEFAKVVGGAPMYACRAWVNFDATTTPPTIRGSGNVAGVTKNSTGDFTITFTKPMPDTAYVISGMSGSGNGRWVMEYDGTWNTPDSTSVHLTGSFRVRYTSVDGVGMNAAGIYLAVFR